ncbi:MAG: hypothetical protein A3F26_01445 [Candidatus Ryanbacteria bacterium RIFCSPHIGHO2_12_FULL_47_12b]|uniref:Penicillin-binding protein transpeptidase domain-containing protein n=2 Tax=Parcubacteria group TaxID=1794811 RepID=A0A1G2H139_9BACT|nr:MAG: Peptidoglycan glycosyltransferase [Parcubacteria group bacterium GW2011_GWA2_47_10b]OGZ46091.1 MAG: hypothetical protein A2844_00925 [Candidatus Ryanbacteria bacterium RIFCSPHIGHO2_01_FULL_48_80]OGZ49482.1 MAG: hypothetical protein A3C83_02275 [Candidatus Ryanbacteria bacterium RIFCSPHIGHO2_02_FULL_47_25]OGZ52333.1 MAG: hypothetical protein A3F26_01445 [Candidatus Ryanbacteria bacterium RIFCSPHIGHO2_12_FULL_47_12b]OGZ53208.1 MAG: hypothetical protein A3A29_02205 [Candidatus Ryanbacteria
MDGFTKRAWFTAFWITLVFAGVIARVFWLQIVRGDSYATEAIQQQKITQKLKARRGSILAHEKERSVPLAVTKNGWILGIDPRLIDNPKELYVKLTDLGVTALSEEEFTRRASKKDDPYEIIEERVSRETKEKVENAQFPGVYFSPDEWRFYPAGDFASQILGFVDKDGIGKYGLEQFYHYDLLGENGVFEGEKTPGGRLLLFGDNLLRPQKDGVDIVLTIDTNVQILLESTLRKAYEKYGALRAGGIILNPATGAILGMATVPSFDPNQYSDEKDISVFRNPNTESLFEMGSVVKPLTMAAALDTGAVTPHDTYYDAGRVTIDTEVIANFDGKGRGQIPIQEILAQSLNTGAVHLMQKMGKDLFRQYMKTFGLGELTDIDLPNEVEGNIKNLESSRVVEYATASFGQGIAMTPIVLVRALGSIANDGLLVNPYLVEETRYPNGARVQKRKSPPKRIISEETALTVTRMMVEIVDRGLGNGTYRIPGYSVAAKTGTAQIALSDGRGYSNEYLHTFVGYGPAYDAQFFVFLYLEQPHGARYASETLSKPFHDIMQQLFSYFEIRPDRPHELESKL